jgi:hypothetical protein
MPPISRKSIFLQAPESERTAYVIGLSAGAVRAQFVAGFTSYFRLSFHFEGTLFHGVRFA